VTQEALSYLDKLFRAADATGLALVEDAVAGLEDPAFVRTSLRALVGELLAAVG
jgi:hypothetical protein